jgi:fimbrial chaperone protein
MLPYRTPAVAGVLILAGACIPARAGSFQVQPVRLEFSAKRQNTTIQIRNRGAEATTIQAHIVSWTAQGTEEVMTKNDDLLLNPPIFSVQAGQAQFLRVGFRRPRQSNVELSYRLVLEEVPQSLQPGFAGVQTLLKISIPIFFDPPAPSPNLIWGVQRASETEALLWVENQGNAHAQILRLQLSRAQVIEPEFTTDQMMYVLPQGRKEWRVPIHLLPTAQKVFVQARTDRGEVHATVEPIRP